jgi:phosphate acyltransferase
MSITVALDAMGGDHAPDDVVAGGVRAAAELGVRIVLVGRVDEIERVQPAAGSDVELVAAADVIGMDEPPTAVRAKKDSSVARCAQLVRDGAADAMVSAGNTGAAMAAAVLRMGRTRGVARPAVAVPVPVPGHHPQILVDAGATVDCTPEWLVQFARMGREYARTRLGVDAPTVGLLSNGEEAGKGDELRKAAHDLLAAEVPGFVGNVEGRDFMRPGVDVIVTDGFTGNVALKTIEGTIRAVASLVLRVLESTPEARDAGKIVLPLLLEAAQELEPDNTGGALLLGVRGVCVISHGSSGETAIVNAVRCAMEAVEGDVVARVEEAARRAG